MRNDTGAGLANCISSGGAFVELQLGQSNRKYRKGKIYEKTICADPFRPFRNWSGRSNHGLRRVVRSPKWAARPRDPGRAMRAEYCGRIGNKHCEKFVLF